MKILFTLLFISVCSFASGQTKTVTATGTKSLFDELVNQSLERKFDLSKGEQFTEKEWQEYYKAMAPHVKMFFKRDSAHNKFLQNTIVPNLLTGDTIQEYKMSSDFKEIILKLKPKKP